MDREERRKTSRRLSFSLPLIAAGGTLLTALAAGAAALLFRDSEGGTAVTAALVTAAAAAGIAAIQVFLVRRRVTEPVKRLSRCTDGFAFGTEEDRMNNYDLLKQAEIHTGDEIEDIYRGLVSVTRDSLVGTTGLSQARMDIRDQKETISKISRDAYRDRLTRVGNAAAYRQEAEKLNQAIADGQTEFGIVMFDVNNLKYVNDVHGHMYGDQYLQGCCQLICRKYSHSPVFRVGGDEFVAVLRGDDYRNREQILRETREAFESSFADESKNAWERYSASIGMAVYEPGDESAESVFARADKDMYGQKQEFHQKVKAYRQV